MSIPWPEGRPDTSVSSDQGTQLAQGMQVMVRSIQSLERVIQTQTAMLERTQNANQRYQMAGQAQMRQDILQQVASAGGVPHGARTTQVTPMGALSSLESMQGLLSQRLGQWIAGTPLFEQPAGNNTPYVGGQQPGAGGGVAAGAGGTPVGTPTSAGRAPGAGAGGSGGRGGGGGAAAAAAPQGPGGGGGGRAGLPAMIWGAGTHGAPQAGQVAGTAVLQQLGARVAMSGGGGLSTITSALRAIPGVGLVMDLANAGTNFYLKQREANRVYQSVEGGANISGFAERAHALAYQASMYGLMPSGAAAQSFGGVTALGYNMANSPNMGSEMQNRQSALDFIYHNYTATGMDVNQSLQALQAASQDANVNLTQLSTTLNNLSNVAGQAGANADTARQQFISYFNQALGMGAGNGATGIAGGVSSLQASLGKQFSGVNFGGELSQAQQYLLSGMTGLSPAQLQYTARNNPGAYNQLLAGKSLATLTEGGLMTPQMMTSMQGMIKAAGGGNALMSNPGLTDQIANQWLNQWQIKGNINTSVWAQEINALTGLNMTPTQAMQWVVSQVGGVNEASHNATVASKANPGATVRAGNIGNAPTGRYGLATSRTGVGDRISSLFEHGNVSGESWQDVLRSSGPAGQSYVSQEQRTGRRSPVLEALLQNTNSTDQVSVNTRNGVRVMSIADAMKYYPEELAAGNVEFYNSSGQAIGNTSAITHGLTNPYAKAAAESAQSAGSDLGVSLSQYQRTHTNSQVTPQGGGQAVTVTLSSEAKQLLKLLPGNNDQAAASSQVPSNPYAGSNGVASR